MFVAPRIPWLPETFSSYRVFFPFIFQSLPISLITWWSPINIMICDMHLNSSLNYWTTDLASEFHWELTRLLLIIYNNIVFYLKRLKVTKKISKWAIPNCKKKNKVLTQNYINLGKWNNVGNLGNWATRIVFLLRVGRV